jgi:transcription elongation factor GreA
LQINAEPGPYRHAQRHRAGESPGDRVPLCRSSAAPADKPRSPTFVKEFRLMMDFVPMTREAYNRKKAEVDRLEQEEMSKIAEKIAVARSEGDLKENAEYHAQREAQGLLQAKINQLRGELSRARIVDTSNLPRDEVAFGATVVVKDLDYGDEEEFTLVGAGDEDYDAGRYLITSPIGQGLLGKKKGERVEIPVPKGTLHYEIVEIRYDESDGVDGGA